MDDRWLSMKEICAYLGVSHDTISRWIANHDMPSIKMGKCWKFKKDQIFSDYFPAHRLQARRRFDLF